MPPADARWRWHRLAQQDESIGRDLTERLAAWQVGEVDWALRGRHIMSAGTWQEVIEIVDSYEEPLDCIDLATALRHISSLLGIDVLQLHGDEFALLRDFVQRVIQGVLVSIEELKPDKRLRCVGAVLLSLARLHFRPPPEKMRIMCGIAREVVKAPLNSASYTCSLSNLALALGLLDVSKRESTGLLPDLKEACLLVVRVFVFSKI